MGIVTRTAAALVILASAAAAPTGAATVDWRQGSGNTGNDFTVMNGTLGGGGIELGLRAIEPFVGTIAPIGNVYHVQPGPASNPSRARWNFDIHVNYDFTIAGLDDLTLSISTLGGSSPSDSDGVFDLLALRSAIDCHVLNCANSGSGVEEPEHFYQASQNPTFGWFNSFEISDPSAVYYFTLTATEAGSSVSTSMIVLVGDAVLPVPEPATLALSGAGLLGLAWARRRNRRV